MDNNYSDIIFNISKSLATNAEELINGTKAFPFSQSKEEDKSILKYILQKVNAINQYAEELEAHLFKGDL